MKKLLKKDELLEILHELLRKALWGEHESFLWAVELNKLIAKVRFYLVDDVRYETDAMLQPNQAAVTTDIDEIEIGSDGYVGRFLTAVYKGNGIWKIELYGLNLL